jgi:hypothetical protein
MPYDISQLVITCRNDTMTIGRVDTFRVFSVLPVTMNYRGQEITFLATNSSAVITVLEARHWLRVLKATTLKIGQLERSVEV